MSNQRGKSISLTNVDYSEFMTESEFVKAYPQNKYDYYTEEAIASFCNDLVKGAENNSLSSEEIEKGHKDYSKLVKKTITTKAGVTKVVWVSPIQVEEGHGHPSDEHARAYKTYTDRKKYMSKENARAHVAKHFSEELADYVHKPLVSKEDSTKDNNKISINTSYGDGQFSTLSAATHPAGKLTKLEAKPMSAREKHIKERLAELKAAGTLSPNERNDSKTIETLGKKFDEKQEKGGFSGINPYEKNKGLEDKIAQGALKQISEDPHASAVMKERMKMHENAKAMAEKDKGLKKEADKGIAVIKEKLSNAGYTLEQIRRMTPKTQDELLEKRIDSKTVSILPDGSYQVIEKKQEPTKPKEERVKSAFQNAQEKAKGNSKADNPILKKFMEKVQISDNKYNDINKVSVEATPKGNWRVYYEDKDIGLTINSQYLSESDIRKYELEHHDTKRSENDKWAEEGFGEGAEHFTVKEHREYAEAANDEMLRFLRKNHASRDSEIEDKKNREDYEYYKARRGYHNEQAKIKSKKKAKKSEDDELNKAFEDLGIESDIQKAFRTLDIKTTMSAFGKPYSEEEKNGKRNSNISVLDADFNNLGVTLEAINTEKAEEDSINADFEALGIEKGHKDYSKLVKKTITTKAGVTKTVYVNLNKDEKAAKENKAPINNTDDKNIMVEHEENDKLTGEAKYKHFYESKHMKGIDEPTDKEGESRVLYKDTGGVYHGKDTEKTYVWKPESVDTKESIKAKSDRYNATKDGTATSVIDIKVKEDAVAGLISLKVKKDRAAQMIEAALKNAKKDITAGDLIKLALKKAETDEVLSTLGVIKGEVEQEEVMKHEDKLGEGAKKRDKLKSKKDKVAVVMKEYSKGTLHSGSGEKVTDRNQAVAIAMSEAGLSKAEEVEILLNTIDI